MVFRLHLTSQIFHHTFQMIPLKTHQIWGQIFHKPEEMMGIKLLRLQGQSLELEQKDCRTLYLESFLGIWTQMRLDGLTLSFYMIITLLMDFVCRYNKRHQQLEKRDRKWSISVHWSNDLISKGNELTWGSHRRWRWTRPILGQFPSFRVPNGHFTYIRQVLFSY